MAVSAELANYGHWFLHVHIIFARDLEDIHTQVRVKIFVPNKKGDIGMEVYYLCQSNTYVIAHEFGEQQ